MSWLEFVAAFSAALAWPCAIVCIVLMLRRQISAAIIGLPLGNARRLSVGRAGLDIEFVDSHLEAARLELASDNNEVIPATLSDVSNAISVDERRLGRFLQDSPTAAIADAFARTQELARSVAEAYGLEDATEQSDWLLAGWLHRQGAVGTSTYEAYVGLERTRDEAIRVEGSIDPERALKYLALAAEVQRRLTRSKASAGGA